MGKGDLSRALEDFTRAIEIDPKDAQAIAGRGFARAALNQSDGAIKDLQRFLELAPKDPRAARAQEIIDRCKGP